MKIKVMNIVNNISQNEVEAGKLQESYDIDVDSGKAISLPESFNSSFRPDLINRVVKSSRANRRQAYGSRKHEGKKRPMSGMKHSVEWWGKGRGVARIMRITGMSRGAEDPRTRGGRRAHGPKVEKDWSSKSNSKERSIARDSALSASADIERVKSRGHIVDDLPDYPIVLGKYTESGEDGNNEIDFETFSTKCGTRKFLAIMNELGLGLDLQRAKNGRKIRAGKGKMRGRKYRTPKSMLLVVSQKDGLSKAARNLPGVDVVSAKDLSAEDLAPGGDPGRLTVFTREAIEVLN